MRWLIFIALLPYSIWLIFAYEYHFIDGVNLAFHEAGHLLFIPLVDGGVHDWNYLFAQWEVLYRAERIATFFHITAYILLIAALVFMFRQILKGRKPSIDAFLSEE